MLRKRIRGLRRRLARKLGSWLISEWPALTQATLPEFANRPRNLIIEWPRRINQPDAMFFGDDVWLGPNCFLSAVRVYPSPSLQRPGAPLPTQHFQASIHIGSRVTCSGGLVLGAAQRITIGDDVLIASNVAIFDNLHGYRSIDLPFKYQPLEKIAPVHVRAGSWLGQNVVILPGVTIGEMAIVGANSVVAHDVPPRAIAVGAPARVIKEWDESSGEWRVVSG